MVAEHSQHMLGKAMDTTMPGMSMEKVREVAMRLQMGGVGFYGDSAFVHIDVGNVRYWPRMSYAQLEHVFPDGKTVLVAANGKTLPGYEEARAELAANGRVAQAPPSRTGTNFFAWLFGGGKSADESEEETQTASSAPAPAAPTAAAEKPQEVAEASPATKPEPIAESKHESALIAEAAAEETAPVPPHRPTDFLALADVPLPPGRPTASFETAEVPLPPVRAIETASASEAAPEETAALPTIITRGASESSLAQGGAPSHTEPQVLAYAPVAQIGGLRSALRGKTASRTDKTGEKPGVQELAKLEHQTVMSPTLTGLRRAGQIETAALSQKLAAGYLARFANIATNLPTDHFAGPAVVGLRTADRSRMMFIDNALALKTP
jgi:hypothetical protein